jgi:hypothetical protein
MNACERNLTSRCGYKKFGCAILEEDAKWLVEHFLWLPRLFCVLHITKMQYSLKIIVS